MKRRDIIRKIRTAAAAAQLPVTFSEGGNHTVVNCGGARTVIGQHTEIGDLTARRIFTQLEDALGKDWWR